MYTRMSKFLFKFFFLNNHFTSYNLSLHFMLIIMFLLYKNVNIFFYSLNDYFTSLNLSLYFMLITACVPCSQEWHNSHFYLVQFILHSVINLIHFLYSCIAGSVSLPVRQDGDEVPVSVEQNLLLQGGAVHQGCAGTGR